MPLSCHLRSLNRGGIYSKQHLVNAPWYSYDPNTARFLQEDTYSGDNNNPPSLNLYIYCHNEPIMYSGPNGHREDIGGGYTQVAPEDGKVIVSKIQPKPTPKAKPKVTNATTKPTTSSSESTSSSGKSNIGGTSSNKSTNVVTPKEDSQEGQEGLTVDEDLHAGERT